MPHAQVVTRSAAAAASSSAARPFVCTSKVGPRAAWITAAGELSVPASVQLGQTLREAQLSAPLLVLDLRELTFIEGSGVAVILDAARRAQLAGHRLMVVRGPVQVDRPLTLAGAVDQVLIFDLDADEPAAGLLDAA